MIQSVYFAPHWSSGCPQAVEKRCLQASNSGMGPVWSELDQQEHQLVKQECHQTVLHTGWRGSGEEMRARTGLLCALGSPPRRRADGWEWGRRKADGEEDKRRWRGPRQVSLKDVSKDAIRLFWSAAKSIKPVNRDSLLCSSSESLLMSSFRLAIVLFAWVRVPPHLAWCGKLFGAAGSCW